MTRLLAHPQQRVIANGWETFFSMETLSYHLSKQLSFTVSCLRVLSPSTGYHKIKCSQITFIVENPNFQLFHLEINQNF